MPNKSLTTFSHQTNSTTFTYTDLGDLGAKLGIGRADDWDEFRAIILPPDKAEELGIMILKGMGQDVQKIPPKVLSLLQRIDKSSGRRSAVFLEFGERTAVRYTLRLWRISQGKIRRGRNKMKGDKL